MNSLNQFFTTAAVLTTLSFNISHSQILGSRENSQSSPKVAEASTLSGGTFTGDVNTMTGQYNASIPLGTVSTPGGLSYNLNLEHNSSFSLGPNIPVSSGIPYGEGWNLALPTISVETEVFHRFYNSEECEDSNPGTTFSTNDESSPFPKSWEGDAFWFAPEINIPGVGGGRAVFKYVDASTGDAVFVLNKFESPMEIRFNTSNGWLVKLADGTTYEFGLAMINYKAPSNKRLFPYDPMYVDVDPGSAGSALTQDQYTTSTNEILENAVEPKVEYSVWHCTVITNNNLFGQAILFEYEKFGKLNFFSEFIQPNYQLVHRDIYGDVSLEAYQPDFSAYRDVYLKRVTSFGADETPIDILELEYDKLDEAYNTPVSNLLLNPDDADVTSIDPLYCSKVVRTFGNGGESFSTWRRYEHVYKDYTNALNINYIGLSNPYLNTQSNSYHRESVGTPSEAAFDHGFLESPSLSLQNLDMMPGDIYEIRTKVIRPDGSDLKNGNGTIDIAIVTKDGTNIQFDDTQESISSNAYEATRGEELFSTFNMALKWQMGWQQTSVQTSNFFVMPNVPNDFNTFRIQVGPGNSDIQYNYYDYQLYQRFLEPQVLEYQPNAISAYPQVYGTQGMKSASAVPRNFGTGHPWGMMAPIYNLMARSSNSPLISSGASHELLYLGTWFMSNQDIQNYQNHHNPTKFNSDIKLKEVELVRYSKVVYMLKGVKQYKINGEYEKSVNETGKKLITQKKLDYQFEYITTNIRNQNYEVGQPIAMEGGRIRQVILLSAVHDVPLEGNLYANNFGLSDPGVVASTKLEYANIIPPITQTTLFDPLKAYQGFTHYALVKYIDQLGGETSIEYYPLDQAPTRVMMNANYTFICGITYDPPAYGTDRVYTIHPAVRYISKEVEQYNPNTGSYDSPTRRWEYVYDVNKSIYNRKELYLPYKHFRGHFFHQGDMAYGKVTVYSPELSTGERNYAVYEYYGKQPSSGPTTIEEFLFYGKPKSVKQYDNNGVLHASTDYQYDYTLAFENGYKRPNFVREGIGHYDHPIFRDYEYKDYYLQEEMTVDNPNGPGLLTGDEARLTLAPESLREGTGIHENPKFLPLFLFSILHQPFSANDVNGQALPENVTNPDYFLNSYFIKKTAEINRTYEDGLSKSGIAVIPAEPVFETIDSNPFGTGIVNPVIYDPESDYGLISAILANDNDVIPQLLSAAPLCDEVLEQLVQSFLDPDEILSVMSLHSAGFSDDVWKVIIDYHTNYTPAQLHQLVYQQPYFTDDIQRYQISIGSSKYDDKFYQALLLRNPVLSDNVIKDLCIAKEIPGESFGVVLSGQTHQMNGNLLTNIIQSRYLSNANYLEILSDQWLSEDHYSDLLNYSFLDNEAIVTLIEQHYVKPTDATIEEFITNRNPSLAHAQRVVDVIDREMSAILIGILRDKYERPYDIIFPTNINPLNKYCGNTLSTDRIYIETKTEYQYYEADYRGVAQGKAFELLLGKISSVDEPSAYPLTISAPLVGSSNLVVPHLQLKHEPSWQVFSVKITSPHQPGAFNREEYFYYYDLQNRYDRIWHNFDQSANSAITSLEFFENPDTGEILDTIARNTNYTDYYTDYPPLVPAFDGMAGAREKNLRTIAFQKTTFSKNTRDNKALRRSEYYDYDRRWNIDDLTPTDQFQTEIIDTEPCPTPPSYACDECFYANHVFTQDQIDLYLAEGYCVWEATPGSGWDYDYYLCPENADMTECEEDAILIACPDDLPDVNIPGNGYLIVGKELSKSLQLREVTIQVDTIDVNGTNPFDDYKVDPGNIYIAEFEMGNPDDYDANNFAGGEYNMVLPFTNLTVRTIDERNRHLQPLLEHNQVDLKTRYYYDELIRKRYISDDCPSDNYTTKINTNIGLPVRITVGYERSDSLSTAYEYTDAGKVKKVTEPSGKYMEYAFDGFHRLINVKENGTHLLTELEYHDWDNDENQSFHERTEENYVQTKLYNSGTLGDFQWQRTYTDPLVRADVAITSYYEGNTIYHTYSGSTIFDNWDRTVRVHKNSAISASYDPVNDTYDPAPASNYSLAYSDSYYENTPKNRSREVANFGVNINDPANHTVRTDYAITNNVYTSCELGLSLGELPQIMGAGSTSAFRFYRSETFDQDNKRSVEYINATGQKVATIKYNDGNEKIVTLFVYDSYGNLAKVINPKKQHNDYAYNIIGQLYQERTVDAGLKKYMYNKQGLVSVTLDEQGWNYVNPVSSEYDPFYRVYDYDIYGRILKEGRSVGPNNYWKRATYGPLHYQTQYVGTVDGYPVNYDETANGAYFDYLFTNASTQDWLCHYDVWGWDEPEMGYPTYEPLKVTIKNLFSEFPISEQEKGYLYGTNTELTATGKIKEAYSFNNQGAMIQKTVYTYSEYDNIASQTVYFNPDQVTGAAPVFPNTLSVIEYPAYNYRKALLEEKVDVDGNSVVDVHYFYEYDKLNRLKGVYAAKGEVPTKTHGTLLVSYEYDDANGVVLKKTHSIANGSTPIEVVETSYSYDVRDRLTSIDAVNQTSGTQAILMDYQLYYDNQQPYHNFGQYSPLVYSENWNGNINGTLMTYNFADAQSAPSTFNEPTLYGYTYDKINRLTMADAMVGDFITGAPYDQVNESFQVGDVDVSYDKIGNITSLLRHLRSQDPLEMLELQHYNYQYTNGTNRLAAVQGLSGTSGRLYTYDENGNLLTDTYRDIDATEYGRAAYAYEITQNDADISYLYSVDDQRMYKEIVAPSEVRQEYYLSDVMGKVIALRSTVTPEGQATTINWEYYAHGLEREARLVPVYSGAKFSVDEVSFYLYDHLGNTRVNYTPKFREGTSIVQVYINSVTDYFPYGKVLREYVNGEKERYLTTQHERDEETGLDYRGARYYDADVARFLSLDPLAKKFTNWSPFNYVISNPVIVIDPSGKSPESSEKPTRWTENHAYLNEVFGDSYGFNSKIVPQLIPWEMTKSRLKDAMGGVSDKAAEDAFEAALQEWGANNIPTFSSLPIMYYSNNWNRYVTPDGTSSGSALKIGIGEASIAPNIIFWEAKATVKSKVYKTDFKGQPGAAIDILSDLDGQDYTKNIFIIATTADVTDISSLTDYGFKKGVAVIHLVSYYRTTSNGIEVTFKWRTPTLLSYNDIDPTWSTRLLGQKPAVIK